MADNERDIIVYTLTEAQKILRCSRNSVYNYIRQGKLKAVKAGGQWIISKENLLRFIDGE